MTSYETFEPGERVRSVYGDLYTVRAQLGCCVFVNELCNGHVHPSKLTREPSAKSLRMTPPNYKGGAAEFNANNRSAG